jgi:hypothetical protein
VQRTTQPPQETAQPITQQLVETALLGQLWMLAALPIQRFPVTVLLTLHLVLIHAMLLTPHPTLVTFITLLPTLVTFITLLITLATYIIQLPTLQSSHPTMLRHTTPVTA